MSTKEQKLKGSLTHLREATKRLLDNAKCSTGLSTCKCDVCLLHHAYSASANGLGVK